MSDSSSAGAGAGAGAGGRGSRRYDIVVYGATGFTGKLVAEYLAKNYAADVARWAIAGRSEEKLRRVQDGIESLCGRKVDMVIANAREPETLARMAAQTRVVISTVGPFARYGEPLVAACAEAGTSYVDSTGESPWVARMIDTYGDAAARTGSIIVPMCGFDSIPSDIGTLFMVDYIRKTYGAGTALVESTVAIMGGASGGTVHSALGMMESKAARTALNTPHLLCRPVTADPASVSRNTRPAAWASWDADLRCWRAPFVMAPVNEQVVRRSAYIAALREKRYCKGVFQYRERMKAPCGMMGAVLIAVVFFFGQLFALLSVVRWALKKACPVGQGPTRKQMDDGFMRIRMVGTTDEAAPRKAILQINGDSDPGYSLTSQMLAESALTIALSRDRCPGRAGGVYTPATGLGLPLATRLHDSGIRFSIANK